MNMVLRRITMEGASPDGLTHSTISVTGTAVPRAHRRAVLGEPPTNPHWSCAVSSPVANSMSKARTMVLFAAVMFAGTLAGFFLTYAFTIMPGLETTDDRTFVAAFQGLERMFGTFDYGYNWPVVLGFLGGPLVIVVAIALDRRRPIVWWLVAALVLSIATILITQSVNIPLNNEIKAAGDADMIEAVQVRADFRENWWRAWNLVRSATSVGAFVCLGWALFLHGNRMRN
ncbi:MAG: DUF1772 domain-containing protein [Acidimicrobiia bacterium]|nr:DUF1772 domain-containing protein [Acidimicrobiia bacterium]